MNGYINKLILIYKEVILERIETVYQVFVNYYGEDFVELKQESQSTLEGLIYDRLFYYLNPESYISLIRMGGLQETDEMKELFNTPEALGTFLLPLVSKETVEAARDLEYDEDTDDVKYAVCNFLGRREFNHRITIHFPEVTITNEFSKSIVIQDLFSRVKVTGMGHMYDGIYFHRATYPKSQFMANYIHSHISGIYTDYVFQESCLGNGPIRDTKNFLRSTYEEGMWGIFCLELDKYTQVESLQGGPYKRMEVVTKEMKTPLPPYIKSPVSTFPLPEPIRTICLDFVYSIIGDKKIPLGTSDLGTVSIMENPEKLMLSLSAEFIKYYNTLNLTLKSGEMPLVTIKDLLLAKVLKYYMFENGQLFELSNGQNVSREALMARVDGNELFEFKGRQIYLKIIEDPVNEDGRNSILLLSAPFIYYLLEQIIYIINYNYDKNGKTSPDKTRRYL